MTNEQQKELGKILWNIADQLRGAMDADDFRDYMLSLLFLKYISEIYQETAKDELGEDYPQPIIIQDLTEEQQKQKYSIPLQTWYEQNPDDIEEFEKLMSRNMHYTIKPDYLWDNIAELSRVQHNDLLETLKTAFKYIENEAFSETYQGLFSEINLDSDKLGKDYKERNIELCKIIDKINNSLNKFSTTRDLLGDAYEYLIEQFASGSGKKAGEFYTPQQVSDILSSIVVLDSQNPATGNKPSLNNILDFACGSGSLLLNVHNRLPKNAVGKIYGQEKNITTYNLARMNMLLHGVKDTNFEIFHGDTLKNNWDLLDDSNPTNRMKFDAIVANPPFSLKWETNDTTINDFRFKNYGVAPKSVADFAFLLHGLHYLSEQGGTMAIVLPHGILFRGNAEKQIRKKLLENGYIDTIIALPANLFYSTGIPVCIIVLKKCKKADDILFINASQHFTKERNQNKLAKSHTDKIVNTYKHRTEEPRYSKRITMETIQENDYNLNISRYVDTTEPEPIIDLKEVHANLVTIEKNIKEQHKKHNEFLKELGLDLLP